MQAIRTTYRGPTNSRSSRITATTLGDRRVSVTVPYSYEGDQLHAHAVAAKALLERLEWRDMAEKLGMHGGATSDGYVWVFAAPSASLFA